MFAQWGFKQEENLQKKISLNICKQFNVFLFKGNHTLNYDEEPMHITSIGVHIPGKHVDWVILNVIESVN